MATDIPFRTWPMSLRIVMIAALAIGLTERIVWALIRKNGSATGEAFNVAVAIAKGRGFADAFAEGQGPTAHLLPIPSTIAGGVYALFGIQSVAAEAILLCMTLGLVFASYWMFAGFFRRIGVSLACSVYGFALLCIAPIYTGMEVFDYRVWEGGITIFAAAIFLRLLISPMSRARRIVIAALPALIFFLNPIVGIAACCALIMWLWQRAHEDWLRAPVVFAAAFVLLFAPWTVRNMMAMGHPIWLRDNLGLELAVGNHPAAVAPADPKSMFDARIAEIHPFSGGEPYRALQAAGGERAYAAQLGRETVAWMKAHPAGVARIWLRHFRELTLPPPWLFQTAHGRLFPVFRAILIDVVHLLGFAGFMLLWRRNRFGTAALLPFVLLPILAYIPFQPITRYTWLYYIPLAYAAAVAAEAIGVRLSGAAPRQLRPLSRLPE